MKRYRFTAEIQPGRGGGAFVFFPFDTQKEFGTKGKVPVQVTFDGVADISSLFKYSAPRHLIGVPKAVREQIGKAPGDRVEVVLWRIEEIREADVPPAFRSLMEREGLLPFFESLSFTHRKEYCRWIAEAKKEDTRARRLEKAIQMLKRKVRTPG